MTLVNEIIENDCRAMGYHAKAMACTKLVNNTQKAYKTADFLKITDSLALNTVHARIIGPPISEAQATFGKRPTLKFQPKLGVKPKNTTFCKVYLFSRFQFSAIAREENSPG